MPNFTVLTPLNAPSMVGAVCGKQNARYTVICTQRTASWRRSQEEGDVNLGLVALWSGFFVTGFAVFIALVYMTMKNEAAGADL